MTPFTSLGLRILSVLLVFKQYSCLEEMQTCNRNPLNTKTDPLPPDARFAIEIIGCEDEYIPNRNYTVRLYSTDYQSSFIAFTIALTGDKRPNEKNPRKPILLLPGMIMSPPNSQDSITKGTCPYTVFEANVMPKTSVEVLWVAPPPGNRCVTIYAYVAVKPDVWYDSGGPLSRQVCEDHRKDEDMKPSENNNCQVCEEARYELKFEGLWSYNTHPEMFPKSEELAKFSDVVGASHGKNFILYKDNSVASYGLKMLAEQGDTSDIEQEILKELGTNVRTVIKATGPAKPSLSTVTSFRTNRQHHFISLVCAIVPSPDWFLGVYNMELCDNKTGRWSEYIRFNMYPMDAGTDSGLTFESPNEVTSPAKAISKANISSLVPYDKMKPFAKLTVTLVRTYTNPECNERPGEPEPGEGEAEDIGDHSEEPYSRPEPETTDSSKGTGTDDECPTTSWGEWWPCEGQCEDGWVEGYQSRFLMVDGVEIGKYFDERNNANKEISEKCLKLVSTSEMRKCKEECTAPTEDPEIEAQGRVWNQVKTGQRWGNL